MLSPTQLSAREGCITASFLPKLMAGNESEILREWQRLVGDPAWVEDDLSDSWSVQFGSFVEPFALDWHEKKTGRALSHRGDVVHHPERPYFCATLDAYRADDATVLDCKAPGPWRKIDDVVAHYTPQLIGQRACLGAERAALLIVHGGQEPVEHPIEWEEDYERLLWKRVTSFWRCVEMLIEPVALAPIAPPVKPEKIYDMRGDNLWASEAAVWLDNHHAARLAQAAEKELKGLVPLDAARAYGHGIEIRRDRAGRLSLRERLK